MSPLYTDSVSGALAAVIVSVNVTLWFEPPTRLQPDVHVADTVTLPVAVPSCKWICDVDPAELTNVVE
jgi:hypothetical protein